VFYHLWLCFDDIRVKLFLVGLVLCSCGVSFARLLSVSVF